MEKEEEEEEEQEQKEKEEEKKTFNYSRIWTPKRYIIAPVLIPVLGIYAG